MRLTRERKPKGSRRHVRLVGAVLLGLPALWGAWESSSLRIGSLGLMMLLAIALAVPAGLLGRRWWHRVPFDLRCRLPRRLSRRARGCWTQRPFLGWTVGLFGQPRWAVGTEEDSVGIVGPPRSGKTGGPGIPQVLMWGGPLISVAPKPELFRLTSARRLELASQYGGEVVIYSPTTEGRVEGLVPVRFSPCSKDSSEVKLRVDSWIEASGTGKGVSDGPHWKTAGGLVLCGTLYAAAYHRVRPSDFSLVASWLAVRDLSEPIEILRGLGTFDGDHWAEVLESIQHKEARSERDSFFSAAQTTIGAVLNPRVLRSTMAMDLDPEAFLLTRSSLYIVAPTEHQTSVAPLLAMLVQTLVHTAYRLHREGRLEARLLVSLDDMANCCPLPQLESIISQGGGQGVNVAWNLQSMAQLRDHFGVEAAEAIWSATRCKEVLGGLSDETSLERVSSAVGEEQIVSRGESFGSDGKRQRSKHVSWRRILAPSQLRSIPNNWALLIYHNEEPRMLRQPLAAKRAATARHMVPWPVAQRRLAAAELRRRAGSGESAREA